LRNPRTMPTPRADAVSQPITRVGTRATARKTNLRALVVSLCITVVLQGGVIAHHDSSPPRGTAHRRRRLAACVLLRRHIGHGRRRPPAGCFAVTMTAGSSDATTSVACQWARSPGRQSSRPAPCAFSPASDGRRDRRWS